MAIHAQQGEVRKKIADNQEQQAKTSKKIEQLESSLGSGAITGSTVDPDTGNRIEVTTDDKGFTHIKTTDPNGNVSERTEPRESTARKQEEIGRASCRERQ